jgi:putative tricarboxylic transport membrane protein
MTIGLVILILLLALVQGIIVGLLPGVPAMLGLVILLPLFTHWPIEAILLFFACYICVTQYFGSVSALLFRVPGESSSLPALEVSTKLHRFTSIIKAYRVTAFTSLVASLVGITLFTILFLVFRDNWAYLFSTKIIILFLTLLLVLLIVHDNNIWFNISMMLVGLLLSHTSEISVLNTVCNTTEWLCFLRTPSEATLILLSLYCVPILFYRESHTIPVISKDYDNYVSKWKNIVPFYKLGIRHGLLGFFAGFTPGAGCTLASTLSSNVEKTRNKSKLLTIVGAAEAGNNSAAISSTIPFLFIGIPITASELFIDNFLSSKFYRLNLSTLDTLLPIAGHAVHFTLLMIVAMLVVNIISFLMCSHFIRTWQTIMKVDISTYLLAIKIFVVGAIASLIYTSTTGITNTMSMSTIVFTLVAFGGIGTWAMIKQHNIVGLALMLIMGPFIVTKYTLAYNLYF